MESVPKNPDVIDTYNTWLLVMFDMPSTGEGKMGGQVSPSQR